MMIEIAGGILLAVAVLFVLMLLLAALGSAAEDLRHRWARMTFIPPPPPKLNPAIEKPDPVLQARFEANRAAGKEA